VPAPRSRVWSSSPHPDQASYTPGFGETGELELSVDLDGMSSGSVQFVTGPALSASPITLSFVAQQGASGPLPVLTATFTNSAGGWSPVVAATPTTFTAFSFSPQPLSAGTPREVVGRVTFALPDPSTNGLFDLRASAFALDGTDMPAQSIGTILVPEPSQLALRLAGIVAVAALARFRG
jgi:hypothetical protein